jgi:hypothetical protein
MLNNDLQIGRQQASPCVDIDIMVQNQNCFGHWQTLND